MATRKKSRAGADLASWRKDHNISQTAFAATLGVQPPTVCEWEKGTRHPRLDHAVAIERETGIKVEAWGHNVDAMRALVEMRDAVNDATPKAS